MRLVALAVLPAALAAVSSSAHAGGYVSAGIGGGASLDGALAANFHSTDHDSGRISLGHRVGPVAVEASYFGAGLTGRNDFTGRSDDWTTRTLGVDLKYFLGLVGPLEGFLKVGLNQTWLDAPEGRRDEYSGRGWAAGVGLAYSFDVASIWLDYTHQDTALRESDKRRLDGTLGLLSLGLSINF